ncbi:MAG TPA: hypothetical protein VG452_06700 [Egibacteraceae bacterium]|nr:hypothetical protein [Egibacteraceae bacterium]
MPAPPGEHDVVIEPGSARLWDGSMIALPDHHVPRQPWNPPTLR